MSNKSKTLAQVIACFAVVALHTNDVFWHFEDTNWWMTSNIINSIFLFAVPVFFMLAGDNLIDFSKRYNIITFIKKRVGKVLIPFFYWSALTSIFIKFWFHNLNLISFEVGINLLIIIFFANISPKLVSKIHNEGLGIILEGMIALIVSSFVVKNSFPTNINFNEAVSAIINLKIVGYFCFFVDICIAYLFIIALEIIPIESRKKFITYCLLVGTIINHLIPLLSSELLGINIPASLNFPVINGSLWYVMMGYLLKEARLEKWHLYLLWCSSILMLIFFTKRTYFASMELGAVNGAYKSIFYFPVMIYSVGVYTWIGQQSTIINNKMESIIRSIRNETFGVYLIHWIVIEIFTGVFSLNRISIYYRVFGSIVFYVLSIVLVKSVKKLPFLNVFFP